MGTVSVRRRGLEIVAEDRSLTPFGGSAVVGELVRRLELIPALDRAIETAPRVGGLAPVKQRARGCSPGQLLVAVADSMLCGGDLMLDLERLRGDEAGAERRGLLRRVLGYLPDDHGPVRARFDSGFYRADLLADCRAAGVRFSISVPRSSAMWSALGRFDEHAWQPADGLKDADVAET